MAYTASFPQSGSSSAEIQVITASDLHVGQAASTGNIPLLVLRTVVGSSDSPVLG